MINKIKNNTERKTYSCFVFDLILGKKKVSGTFFAEKKVPDTFL